MELANAFRQSCGSGLQDVRGAHFEDVAVLDGWDLVPARAAGDAILSHALSTPGTNDDVGRGRAHGLRRYDACRRQRSLSEVREDRHAARDLDQLIHPSNA